MSEVEKFREDAKKANRAFSGAYDQLMEQVFSGLGIPRELLEETGSANYSSANASLHQFQLDVTRREF